MRSVMASSILFALLACGNANEAPPASPTPTATTTEAKTAPPPPASTAAAPAAPATTAAPTTPPPPAARSFEHSKLKFSFSYPDGLTVKEEPKGALVTSTSIAKVDDRSGKFKGPVDIFLRISVALEDGAIPAVAKKTNPSYASAFPKGSEKEFKEEAGYSSKISAMTGAGYQFVIGSHGLGEIDTFIPAMPSKTFVIKCSTTADMHKPTMTTAEQADACHTVVTSLKY